LIAVIGAPEEGDEDDQDGSGFCDELGDVVQQEGAADANDESDSDPGQGTSHSSHCNRTYADTGRWSRRHASHGFCGPAAANAFGPRP
jgi:hypothetical protein